VFHADLGAQVRVGDMRTELERLPSIPPVVLCCDGPHATSPPAGGTASVQCREVWYREGYQAVHRKERVLPNSRFQLVINRSDAPVRPMGCAMGAWQAK